MSTAAPIILACSMILAPTSVVEGYNVNRENCNESIVHGAATIAVEAADKTTAKDYTAVEPESDLWLVAKVICGEAQNCDRTEMEYIASVLLNRVADPDFPNTITEVVYQPGQYGCVNDGNWYKTPTQANWEEAEYILNMFNEHGYTILPSDVVYQAQFPQGSGTYLVTSWGHYYCNK